MKLPSVPGMLSGVRDRWQARGSSSAAARVEDASREPGVPMPLALQGAIEMLVAAVVGLLLGALLLGAVWAAGGFATLGALGSLRLAGQAWLLSHGTPVTIHAIQGLSLGGGGTITLVPLGLTLIPFGLAVVAGRRIARACWRGQFLLPFLTGMAVYALFGVLVGLVCRTEQVSVDLLASALCPLVPAGLGALVGGWSISRSLAAVLGADAASWLARTSQYSRWAGSYVWAVIRAGFLAAVASVAAGALLLAGAMVATWAEIITVYQNLGTGAAGDTALTALQLGFLPNMVLWALAWSAGAGFSLGAGTVTSPFQTVLGPLPQFPALAAVPAGDPWSFAPAVLLLPVLAGLLAGWWFCREGENHLDDWMAIRLPMRWFTFLLSTLLTVAFIATVGAGLVAALAWLSHGSLGIGRLTSVGPDAGQVFLWLLCELAVGAAVGYLLGPWLEHEGYRGRSRDSSADDAALAEEARGGRRGTDVQEGGRARPADGGVLPGAAAPADDRARRPVELGGSRGSTAVPVTAGREPVTAASSPSAEHGGGELSRREEARQRRARRRSEKRKAARLAALDREEPR